MVAGHTLPVAASALIGRGADRDTVVDQLLGGPTRLLTLTGPPGVGKTRLALAVVDAVGSRFSDGAVWVDLAPIGDPGLVAAEILRAVGVERAGGPGGLDALVAALAGRDQLIVLDNCEHLLAASPLISDLVAALPRLRVLATSRQRLHLTAEHEYPVPPLPMPAGADVDDLDRLAANPAVALVLARSPAPVTLNRRTARPLAEICVRLDGLPLALELAAARLRIFTPAELAFRLTHRTVGLAGSARDAPPRHRDLEAAIAWSHDLLPDAQRAVFRRLSVFAGGWGLDAAEAVAGGDGVDVVAAVESLLDMSLIRRIGTDADARFGLLVGIREFATDRLTESGEAAATTARHLRHFAGVARWWEATVGTNQENVTWVEVGTIRADLIAAFERERAAGPGEDDVDSRLWLAATLGWLWYTRGSLAEAGPLLDAISADADDPRAGLPARAAALTAAGVVALGVSDLDRAERDLRRGVALSTDDGDQRRVAAGTAFLGHVAREREQFAEAERCYTSARDSYERLGNLRGTAWAAFDLGLLIAERGEPAEAEALLGEALTLFEDLSYEWAAALSAWGLANVLLHRGSVDEAAALLHRAYVQHERTGDRRGTAQCLEALAAVAVARGAPANGARLVGAAQTHRAVSATQPVGGEQHRLNALDATIRSALGRVAANHERHAGRTASHAAILTLVERVARIPDGPAAVTLTPRQVEVATLVAASRTNRQIGRALGISEKTAEIHVRNIMRRLHTSSRAGVAAWVAARDP